MTWTLDEALEAEQWDAHAYPALVRCTDCGVERQVDISRGEASSECEDCGGFDFEEPGR